MRINKSKNIIIAVLCGFMVLMGVSYSLLSQQLTINSTAGINSTWNIEITNINVINTKGYAENDEQGTSIAADKANANLSAKFQAPGDSITYEIEVSNLGTIAGKIQNIVVNQVGENQDIIIVSTDTSNGTLDYLAPAIGKGTFNVTLTFNENVTELPTSSTGKYQVKKMANEGVSYNFIVQPSFVQASSQSGTNSGIDSEHYVEPEFTVLSNGTLVKYNYDEYYDESKGIVIPESVNGIKINRFSNNALRKFNVAFNDDFSTVIIFAKNDIEYNEIKKGIIEILSQDGGTTENIEFKYPNELELTDEFFGTYTNIYYDLEKKEVASDATLPFENISLLDLRNVNITETSVVTSAFYNLNAYEIILPKTLVEIATTTFYNCNIHIITIPSSIIKIGHNAIFQADEKAEFIINFEKSQEEFEKTVEVSPTWYNGKPTFNFNYIIPNN